MEPAPARITAASKINDVLARHPGTGPIFTQGRRLYVDQPHELYARFPGLTVGDFARRNEMDPAPLLVQLNALVGRARRAGVRTSAILLEGVPHERVARAARSKKADLLVIGTHGRSGLAKLFLGSVASRLVAMAPRPVLTVRGR